MMRVLLDTNIVLDRLLRRLPWFATQADFWQAVRDGRITEYVSATTVTDIFYIARRIIGREAALSAVRECLEAFQICAVDGEVLADAIGLPGRDYEDNVQIVCAGVNALDAIITRDEDGFAASTTPILTPAEAVARLAM